MVNQTYILNIFLLCYQPSHPPHRPKDEAEAEKRDSEVESGCYGQFPVGRLVLEFNAATPSGFL